MRKLLWLAVFFVCAWPAKTDDGYGWAVVYKGQQCRKTPYTGVMSLQNYVPTITSQSSSQGWGTFAATPCSYGTEEATITEWFPTKDLALQRVNGKFFVDNGTAFSCAGGISCWDPLDAGTLIGIFKTERLELKQVQVSTHQVPVQRTDYVDVPTMEWREKQ